MERDAGWFLNNIEQGVVTEDGEESGDGTTADDYREESGDGTTADDYGEESGDGTTADDYREESGDGTTADDYGEESGDGTTADDYREESGDGTTADDYGEESGDGTTADDYGEETTTKRDNDKREEGDGMAEDDLSEIDSEEYEAKMETKKKKGNSYLPGKRKARRCCFCGQNYLYLTQHLHRQHRVSDPDQRKKLMGKARELEPISHSGKPSSSSRLGYSCPYPGCHIRGLKRLDVHLENQHGLKRKGPQFCSLLRSVSFRRGKKKKKKNTEVTKVQPKSFKPSKEDVLSSFEEYLFVSNGCNSGARKTARATRRNLFLLCNTVHVEVQELLRPAMPQKIVVALNETQKRPGTQVKYLNSLKKFGQYLTLYEESAKALDVSQAMLHKTMLMVADFIKSVRPRVVQRQAELKSQINGLLIDGGTVKKCLEQVEGELEELTDEKSRVKKPTWTVVRRVRNLLILKTVLSQAPRPSVIENATLGDYQNRKIVVAPETFEEVSVIEVGKHKTSKNGPATIVVDDRFGKQLRAYICHYRPYTNCEGIDLNAVDSNLFLDQSKTFSVSRVSQEAERAWKSFGFGNIRCTSTIVRKTAATKAVRGLSTKDADAIAELMEHRPETQRQYYVASQEMREKVRASKCLLGLMQSAEADAPSPVDKCRSPSVRDKADDLPPMDQSRSSPVREQTQECEMDSTPKTSVHVKTFYTFKGTASTCSRHKAFNADQEKILMQGFQSFQEEGGSGFKQAANYIQGRNKELSSFTLKQLADKIRHTNASCSYKAKDSNSHTANGDATSPRIVHQKVLSDDAIAISSVSEEGLRNYLQRNVQYLRKVSCGKVESWRHVDYKRGGSCRAGLTYKVYGPPYTSDQHEVLLTELMAVFSPGSTRWLDYVCKVLLPEAMIKICQDILGVSKTEAVNLLEKPTHDE